MCVHVCARVCCVNSRPLRTQRPNSLFCCGLGHGVPGAGYTVSPKQGFPEAMPLPLEVSGVPVRPRVQQPRVSPGMVQLNPGTESPLMDCAGLFSLFLAFCFVAVACLEHPCWNAGSGLGPVKFKFANPIPRQRRLCAALAGR